jgi:hypothetical protein
MARPASFSGWLLEIEGRPSVQMNDYPRQNPAYRLTYFILKGRRKLRSFFIGHIYWVILLGDILRGRLFWKFEYGQTANDQHDA